MSSQDWPYVDHAGFAFPPHDIARLNTNLPSSYGITRQLVCHFSADWPVNQERADGVHFFTMMRSRSTACANKRPGMACIPFVNRHLPEGAAERFGGCRPGASRKRTAWRGRLERLGGGGLGAWASATAVP